MTSDEIHLIVLDLKTLDPLQDEVRRFLSPDEIDRSKRLKLEGAPGRFVLIRGLLRRCLGNLLDADPASLRFDYGLHGKPCLSGRGSEISFNVSHSGHLAVFALTEGRAVGVDVEQIRPLESKSLVERYFSVPESILYHVQLPEKRELAFFHFWTAKEAYLKARGEGMSLGLKAHAISEPWEDPPRLTWVDGDAKEAARWTFHRFWPREGYIGTLTYSGGPVKIKEVSELKA